ncbi:MAG: aldo/keto reductase [Rhodobacteraceae bacterium]|nr:aldo/keto reductase [Paracoccaceae bacterium]
MKMSRLGNTDQFVSELCLGTMTYGTQTSQEDAFCQMDLAFEAGINIFDTAELYPVNPISQKTQGDSERIVGRWLKQRGKRDNVYIATKIAGEGMKLIRNGEPITSKNLPMAVEASLRLLQTDYIDLYQIHWPNRGSYMFRQNWNFDPSRQNPQQTLDNMLDVLEGMNELVKVGKVRHFGLSNESAWGTAQWLHIASQHGLPKVETLQNEYSLLCRLYDTDLSELSFNENVGLLAYSPLATGLLTDKYQNGCVTPLNSRMALNPTLGGRVTPRVWPAIETYKAIAEKYHMSLTHMSLAWCRYRPFMASAIIGATHSDQLKYLLKAVDVALPEECLLAINNAHREHPMPF